VELPPVAQMPVAQSAGFSASSPELQADAA
jgi:hypothetical protein